MTIFQEYQIVHTRCYELQQEIDKLVYNWVEEQIGFVTDVTQNYKGLTRPGECAWIIHKDHVTISYSIYDDKYGDYWSDTKYIDVSFDKLLKYAE